ncbi:hypothetical protein [Streptomyces justiciae]|uniref:hypothetical protein n=1 Tax=Streptomyces justiciae TaxID=2780140 RepID=UPI002118D35D|nr:hypothetical protein [Streptomyces justiciae]MCW8382417.1 hypothetical protein [Streptomyces justiciae]
MADIVASLAPVSGCAALTTALAGTPGRVVWVCVAVTVVAALPTLIPAVSKARTEAMWRRREDGFLAAPADNREGLDHIARVRQQACTSTVGSTPAGAPSSEGPTAPSDGAAASPSP